MSTLSSDHLNKLVSLNLSNSTNLQGLVLNIDKLSNSVILYEYNSEKLTNFNFNNIKFINIEKVKGIELLNGNVTKEELELVNREFINSLKS